MKRFTDTEKWADNWFMNLSPVFKTVWLLIVDKCDHAGIFEANPRLIAFLIGSEVDTASFLNATNGRVVEFKPDKWFIKPFIKFQYGIELNPENSAHAGVIKRLKEHGLECPVLVRGYKGATKGLTVPSIGAQDKDKDKDKDKAQEVYSPESRVALHWLNEKSGKRFRESESSLAPINARLKESGVDIAGVRKMISRQCELWKGTRMQEYLRPETLFGKEKFNGYYAAKDLPVNHEDKKIQPHQQNGY